MSALDDLFIEIEKHSIMRGHASLLLESKKELNKYREIALASLEFINGKTLAQYQLAYDRMLKALGKE